MYLDQPTLFTPYAVAWLAFFGIGIGVLLMLGAGHAAARGAHFTRVEREGRMGVWCFIIGIGLLVAAGAWAVVS